MKGCLRWFEALMKARILATRSGTEGKAPRRMACRSMMANQTSTRFSQDPEVGGEMDVEPGVRGQPAGHKPVSMTVCRYPDVQRVPCAYLRYTPTDVRGA